MLTMKKLIESLKISSWRYHLLFVGLLAAIALLFYAPLLSGKVLLQSDIQQYKSMGRQLKDMRTQADKETYWIDNAFVGMPTYQLGAKYPADFLQPFYFVTRFLPRPANLLFLYFLSTYILLTVLGQRKLFAVFGALAFGFSTYLLIILQVGHNTKAEAIGYFPLVLAGFFLLLQNKKLWGTILSVIALGMQIRANHYQMTYYLLLMLTILGLIYGVSAYKNQQLSKFAKQIGLFVAAGIFALGFNATPLMATAEYTQFSTRGPSELSLTIDGTPKVKTGGLEYDYITQYSYGIFESLSLLFPRIQGGGSRENLGADSDLYQLLIQGGLSRSQAQSFVTAVPTYWGDQPILEAPAYIGIVLVFLAILGFLSAKGPLRNGLALIVVLSLLLSWGKNIPWFTHFLVDYFPLYNKFRAVSSAQVLLELCVPLLAVWGLSQFWSNDKANQKKYLFQATLILAATVLALLMGKGVLSFQGNFDSYYRESFGEMIFAEIVAARKQIYTKDLIRGGLYIIAAASVLYAIWLQKLSQKWGTVLLIGLVCLDLLQVSQRYINRDLFVSKRVLNQSFKQSAADRTILADSSRFRVYDADAQLNNAQSAYFHRSIGGYHGAKPRRLQEVFELFSQKRVEAILNMLNVKYVLYSEEGTQKVLRNPEALGIAWPIDSLLVLSSADAAYQQLASLDLKHQAVTTTSAIPNDFKRPAVIDSTFQIAMTDDTTDRLVYQYRAQKDQFVVFSESFYEKGWVAKAGGKSIPIIKVNHMLRGLWLPADHNQVVFTFDPPIVALGTKIRWLTLMIFLLSICTGFWYNQRKVID